MGSSSVFFSCVLLCVAMGTCKAQEFVKMVWVEKPPYTTKRPGTVNRFNGILYDVLKTKLHHCADFESVRVKHESDIVKNVSTGEAVLGGPIVVKGIAPAFYNTLPFISTNNYPGADFITRAEPKEFGKVVTVAVLSTWPLLALTLLMTAIAGIIVWALDMTSNPHEFPRSFLRGSWEGFWWAFISMTTVGYGDKIPKSVPSRIFAMIWIKVGLVVMAIFMAFLTSALTSVSLEPDTKTLHGSTVAVLGKTTEYNLALKSGAKPKVFGNFAKMIKALEANHVGGIFVDRLTGYHYLAQDRYLNLSVVTSEHISHTATVGLVATSKQQHFNITSCLTYLSNFIRDEMLMVISTYNAPSKKPPKTVKLFDLGETSLLRVMLFTTFGMLTAMVVAGLLWDQTSGRNARFANATLVERSSSVEMGPTLAEGRRMLQQMSEYFEQLERRSLAEV